VPIKLHRCRQTWLRTELEACWRVQKALLEMRIPHEVVKHSRRDRSEIKRLTGQRWFPVIEFEDGTAYKEDSRDMAARIRAGELGNGD
jgi:glutathione S-transferase-like protein